MVPAEWFQEKSVQVGAAQEQPSPLLEEAGPSELPPQSLLDAIRAATAAMPRGGAPKSLLVPLS